MYGFGAWSPLAGVVLSGHQPLSYGPCKDFFVARKIVCEGVLAVFVAATTECFLDLSLPMALERLADLEFTSVELALFEDADQFKPSAIARDVEAAIATCRNTQRLDVVSFDTRITAQKQEHYDQFT